MTDENLKNLRRGMRRHRIDVYVMMVSDYHSSEYIGDYFKEIAFLTGFTGENSYVLVTSDKAYIWTDGRYFLQAEREIKGSGFKMIRMGVEGEPTLEEKLKEELKAGLCLGFDGRMINEATAERYIRIAERKGAKVKIEYNLIDPIWKDRPALAAEKLWILSPKYAGK
ncbi:MAG: aminopeptidase P family N-terminal domain-containing protein, partial [Lachnospiraceae bacterium]|nr:aminopeptidase P family N-terminal domain-containing protein [Lachnospiraceae bacterium]